MNESPTTGRLVSFTLHDVRPELRRRHGLPLVRAASDDAKLLDALELTRAIEDPSRRVYRVSEDAWRRVMG